MKIIRNKRTVKFDVIEPFAEFAKETIPSIPYNLRRFACLGWAYENLSKGEEAILLVNEKLSHETTYTTLTMVRKTPYNTIHIDVLSDGATNKLLYEFAQIGELEESWDDGEGRPAGETDDDRI